MKFLILFSCFMTSAMGAEASKNPPAKKIVYTYKQYEKFEFDDLNIEGDSGNPIDLTVSPIHEKSYTNKLPYRKSFTLEIKKGIERVR